jgi:hypothetical protein
MVVQAMLKKINKRKFNQKYFTDAETTETRQTTAIAAAIPSYSHALSPSTKPNGIPTNTAKIVTQHSCCAPCFFST